MSERSGVAARPTDARNSGNKLTEIPPLPAAMRYLDATYNELQSFPKLPADSDMTWLRMSNNFFVKELPSGIGNLAALQQLYVVGIRGVRWLAGGPADACPQDHNSISVLATELGLLTSLTEIRLGQNRLESLPTEIGRLDSVEDFRAEDNRLTELPDVFGDLTNLDDLIVNGNALTDLPPSLAELKLKNPMFEIKVRCWAHAPPALMITRMSALTYRNPTTTRCGRATRTSPTPRFARRSTGSRVTGGNRSTRALPPASQSRGASSWSS